MYHDPALAKKRAADPRPRSAVSGACGAAGMVGLIAWIAVARSYGMDGPYAALVAVVACGLPMIAWSLLVDKVHRNPSTGIDWSNPKPLKATLDTSLVKLAGLWATWAGIAAIYAVCRFYWQGNYQFAMWCLTVAAPAVVALSVPYVLWLDRYLREPRDGAWALGTWLLSLEGTYDREDIFHHLRAWAVKGFFLAFMLSIVPGAFGAFVRWDVTGIWGDPVALAMWLITFMFVVDIAFATVGYTLTMKPLDAHIRTANPYAAGWLAALACYPPFALMAGPLDYHPGTHGDAGWSIWFAGYPVLLWSVGALLVVLTGIYAWATVAFGLRFSNLTHRGILTHGPYAWSKHPAYLAKNLFWWVATVPIFATTGSIVDAARNCVLMAAVSGIYYWRARTEERHLGADPAYRAYAEWMARNGPVPRLFAWIRGEKRVTVPVQQL
jgi:hypothetical protein